MFWPVNHIKTQDVCIHLVWGQRQPDSEPTAATDEMSSPEETTLNSLDKSWPAGGVFAGFASAASAPITNQ